MAEGKFDIEAVIGSIALGNYLSDWDNEKTYDQVMDKIEKISDWSDTDEVEVWEKFEQDSPSIVADHIATLFDDVKTLLESVLNGVQDGSIQIPSTLEMLKTL